MPIITSTATVTTDTDEAGWVMFNAKEFLKNVAGWTVVGSSNGTDWSMSGVDYILGGGDLDGGTTNWIILESPHVAPADRIQIMFYDPSASYEYRGAIAYNSNADYVASSTALPTSSYSRVMYDSDLLNSNENIQMNMLADTDAPYGFAILSNIRFNPNNSRFSLACIPLDSGPQYAPGKPYVFHVCGDGGNAYKQGPMTDTTTATTVTHCIAEGHSPPQLPSAASAAVVYNSAGQVQPNLLPPNEELKDQATPIIFQTAAHYFGVSSFARWNGSFRNNLDTFEDDTGSRGRIVFGDVTFPWDNTTVPTQ